MNPEYTIYINGNHKTCTLAEAFESVYFAYLDSLSFGQQCVPYDIQIVYNDTQVSVFFLIADIIYACEKYAGWLGDMNYILLKQGGIGALARKYLKRKFKKSKFNLKLEEEARRKANER